MDLKKIILSFGVIAAIFLGSGSICAQTATQPKLYVVPLQPGETFLKYYENNANVHLPPYVELSADDVNSIADYLAGVTAYDVKVLDEIILPDNLLFDENDLYLYNYDFKSVLENLKDLSGVSANAGSSKFIGVTGLNINRGRFVDGQAEKVCGQSAIVSVFNDTLRRESGIFKISYLKAEVFKRKIRVTALHELLHLLCLEHCQNKGCVMNASDFGHDLLNSYPPLCDDCRKKLGSNGSLIDSDLNY